MTKKQAAREVEEERKTDGSLSDEAYNKHGFSWENITQINSTAWLTVSGDAVENVVHG